MATAPTSPSATALAGSKKGIRYNKDYNLITLNMLSAGFGSINLKPMMSELSYFEDIYSNFISGQLLITDAQGMIEKMGMHGNEYIRMVFGKDDSPDVRIDLLFRVYKISSRQKTQTFDSEMYAIYFCSDELYMSEQYKVSKSYVNKGIDEIIKDILVNYIKVPKTKYNELNIESTKGIYSFIVPNFKPFEAINWLSTYAQSGNPKATGADMVFFENKNGYNFSSLQSLFTKPAVFTYEYRPKNTSLKDNNNEVDKQTFNVLGYEISKSFDTLEGIASGMFANRVMTLDPLLQRYSTTDFNYAEYESKSTSLNKGAVVNNLANRNGHAIYETPEACFKLAFTNKSQQDSPLVKKNRGSTSNDVFAETVLSQRKSQLALSNYTRMKFFIGGDPSVTVGTTINFNLLSQEPATKTEKKQLDPYYSGKYLITAVRHIIQTGGYSTVIEAVKESLPQQYNLVDNKNQLWKNTVSGVKK